MGSDCCRSGKYLRLVKVILCDWLGVVDSTASEDYFAFGGSLFGRSAEAGEAIAFASCRPRLLVSCVGISQKARASMVSDVVNMELEEDGPPELVDVGGLNKPAPSPVTQQMQDLALSKVPLTIVTGNLSSMTIVLAVMIARQC